MLQLDSPESRRVKLTLREVMSRGGGTPILPSLTVLEVSVVTSLGMAYEIEPSSPFEPAITMSLPEGSMLDWPEKNPSLFVVTLMGAKQGLVDWINTGVLERGISSPGHRWPRTRPAFR